MVQQVINVGTQPGDRTGDPLRDAFIKVNQNFTEIYTRDAVGANFDFTENAITATNSNGNIELIPNGSGQIILDYAAWPNNDGTANQVLTTDGAGNLSWTSGSTGSNTQVAFVDSGALSGNANLTFNKATGTLNVGNIGSSGSTVNLFDAVATTVNIGNIATAISLGSAIGTTTVRNNLSVGVDIGMNGGNLNTSASTVNIAIANTTTINIGGVSSNVNVGGNLSDSIGKVRSIPPNSQTSAYVLAASDNGKHISITTGGVTVPNATFSSGDTVMVYNNSGLSQTITEDTGVTLYLAGTATTGNRTLAQRGLATILCVAANTFVITGGGVS
jgi:hypothetical protein